MKSSFRYKPIKWALCIMLMTVAISNFTGRSVRKVSASPFATITVTTTADTVAADGACSLREAIQAANTNLAVNECSAGVAGLDNIVFNIPGAGVHTINVTSALPTITESVTIDGYTQPGASANTQADSDNAVLLIELNGAGAPGTTTGLTLSGGASTIRGLVINRFGALDQGSFGISLLSGGHTIQGNFIGTDPAGSLARPNFNKAINIEINNGGNLIGGTTPAARNLVSGNVGDGIAISNSSSNTVQGNFIGVNAAGTAALGNTVYGVSMGTVTANNLVGGTTAGARNIISGNGHGIYLGGHPPEGGNNTNHQVLGNYIGLNATGTAAIGNGGRGIEVQSANNFIGGTAAGARNVISGNGVYGILLVFNDNQVQGNFIGTNAAGNAAITGAQIGVAIQGTGNVIGSTVAGAGNVISGNSEDGIRILNTNNQVLGNLIGLDATGAAALGNTKHGINVGIGGNIIGGTAAGARNVISGNSLAGLYLFDGGNQVQGNFIGTNAAGTVAFGNTFAGVWIVSDGNTVGGTVAVAGNLIAGNQGPGVLLNLGPSGENRINNRVLGNSITANAGLGIDLAPNRFNGGVPDGVTPNDAGDPDDGSNHLQNFPVLTSALNTGTVMVSGSLDSLAANSAYPIRLEFFVNASCDGSGNGEGETFVGSTSLSAPGNFTFNFTPVPGKTFLTATATDNDGNTSEFSACRAIITCPSITVNPTNPTLPNATAGQSYNQNFTATGGVGPYTFTISAGALPNGLTLATGGALSGAPTAFGNFNFTVKATDTNGCMGTQAYTLVVNPPCGTITVNPATLANGFVGTAYSQTFTAMGGTGSLNWSVSAGILPSGLTLNSTTGALTGTPTTQGTFTFTVKATDANNCMGTRAYTVIIGGNGLIFYPLPRPVRLLDTRANQGNCDNVSAPIVGGTSITTLARLTCEGITIPPTAQAITGNLTVINNTAQTGYLTIYPDGQAAPLAANMIYGPGDILANNFTVGLGANGNFNIFAEKTLDAIVDISGYYAPPGAGGLYYHRLSKPVRLLDTRPGFGNCDNVGTPIPAGTSITTLARVTCEGLTIPQAAQAIVGNATVINGSGQLGYLTIYPNGVPVPLAANLIYFPGQILSNAFTVSLDANGNFNIFGEKTIDIVVDVAGYYSNEANDVNGAGLLFTPLVRPLRTLDTRPGFGNCDNVGAPITGGTSIATPGRLTCESITIPSTAQTVLGNVTVINQTGTAGYLTLYPDGVAQPLAANMIYFPSQILSNAFVVGLNTGTGQFRIFAERTLDAVVDVSGYFAP